MPAARTPVRKQKPRSNDEIYALLTDEMLPRLKAVEEIAGESHRVLKAAKILNGDGERLLTQLVSDQSEEDKLKQAQAVVAADKAKRATTRNRLLGRPKALAWALALGVASGIGYAVIVHS